MDGEEKEVLKLQLESMKQSLEGKKFDHADEVKRQFAEL